MDLNQYRGNSMASKSSNPNDIPEREPVERVVSGRKIEESPGKKFLSEFFADDIRNIKDYIIYDVLIPATKNAISDAITNGIDIALFGKANARNNIYSNTIKRVPYNTFGSSIYSGSNTVTRRITSPNEQTQERRMPGYRNAYSVQDVLIPFSMDEPHNVTKAKATEALATLRMRLSRYGFVSVADFYETVLNEVPNDIMDHKWGWYDLSGACMQQARDGFILRMPKNVEPID